VNIERRLIRAPDFQFVLELGADSLSAFEAVQ
jgi:hypothetical protein